MTYSSPPKQNAVPSMGVRSENVTSEGEYKKRKHGLVCHLLNCRSKPSGWSLISVLPTMLFCFQIAILEMQDVSQIQSRALDLFLGPDKVIRVFCYTLFFCQKKNVIVCSIHVDHIFKGIIALSFRDGGDLPEF